MAMAMAALTWRCAVLLSGLDPSAEGAATTVNCSARTRAGAGAGVGTFVFSVWLRHCTSASVTISDRSRIRTKIPPHTHTHTHIHTHFHPHLLKMLTIHTAGWMADDVTHVTRHRCATPRHLKVNPSALLLFCASALLRVPTCALGGHHR